MWSLKFTVDNKDSIDTLLTKKYKVTDYFYPIDFYRTGKEKVFIMSILVLEGDEQEQQKFAAALKKHKKVKQFEKQGNILLVLMKEEENFYDLFFDPSLYHPSPAILKNGSETWEVASWDRKKLEELIKGIESNKEAFCNFQLKSLKKTDLKEIYFPKILPELPKQQKKAFEIALEKGYYTWPRKADLAVLAKEMKISISTYQEHLRKAESKLMPFFCSSFGANSYEKSKYRELGY